MDISNDEYSENEEDFHFAYEKGNKKRKSIWLTEKIVIKQRFVRNW